MFLEKFWIVLSCLRLCLVVIQARGLGEDKRDMMASDAIVERKPRMEFWRSSVEDLLTKYRLAASTPRLAWFTKLSMIQATLCAASGELKCRPRTVEAASLPNAGNLEFGCF